METYRNDYTKEEDHALWELHEIRRKIHKKVINTSIEKFNEEAMKKFNIWHKEESFKKTAIG